MPQEEPTKEPQESKEPEKGSQESQGTQSQAQTQDFVPKADYEKAMQRLEALEAKLAASEAADEDVPLADREELSRLWNEQMKSEPGQIPPVEGEPEGPLTKKEVADEVTKRFAAMQAEMERRRQGREEINAKGREKYSDWKELEDTIWSKVAVRFPNADADLGYLLAKALKHGVESLTAKEADKVKGVGTAQKEATRAGSERPTGAQNVKREASTAAEAARMAAEEMDLGRVAP